MSIAKYRPRQGPRHVFPARPGRVPAGARRQGVGGAFRRRQRRERGRGARWWRRRRYQYGRRTTAVAAARRDADDDGPGSRWARDGTSSRRGRSLVHRRVRTGGRRRPAPHPPRPPPQIAPAPATPHPPRPCPRLCPAPPRPGPRGAGRTTPVKVPPRPHRHTTPPRVRCTLPYYSMLGSRRAGRGGVEAGRKTLTGGRDRCSCRGEGGVDETGAGIFHWREA